MTGRDIYTTFSKVLSSSANRRDVQKLHSLIITFGLHESLFFVGKLISRYSHFKDANSSLRVFIENSPARNAYIWNTIIRAMSHNGLHSRAFELYEGMIKLSVKPDKYTFPSVINACGSLKHFDKGRLVHEHAVELGFECDLYIANSLIDMYSRCNHLQRAREVFDKMPHRDIVSWNSLISGYTSNGFFKEALDIYSRLRMDNLVPDSFSLSSVLLSCSGVREVIQAQVVHGLAEKVGTCRYVTVSNALLSMYFKFEMLHNCWQVFNEMGHRDSVTWNTMVCGCFELGLYEESTKLFLEMLDRFEPDILTITSVLRACTFIGNFKLGKFVHEYLVMNGYEYDIIANNIVINMYAKCGDLLRARETFESMESPDLVSWNSLLTGYVENCLYHEAMELFMRMKRTIQPDFITYVTLLSICVELANIHLTHEIHCDVIKQGFGSTRIVGNALVDTYGKCGEIENSLKQFENMKIRDTVTWNSLISSCGQTESCSLGLRMLSRMRMEGIAPDLPTFLSALPLCSYLIAKRQGKELHGCIFKLAFESNISIANALIDMYSKTGSLRNSVLVFEQMKEKDLVSWTSIISAYGMYGEGRKALEVFENMKVVGIIPDHIIFIAVIDACSHSGLVQEGWACFKQMEKDYNITLRLEHYACMVDLLSRSGLVAEAEQFILSMPMKPNASIWGALLSACRETGDRKIAERVSRHVVELSASDPGYHVLASNVYAALGKWDHSRNIRMSLEAKGLRKDRGCSWLDIAN